MNGYAGWSSLAAHRAHNPEVAGSSPAPASCPDRCSDKMPPGFPAPAVLARVTCNAGLALSIRGHLPHDPYAIRCTALAGSQALRTFATRRRNAAAVHPDGHCARPCPSPVYRLCIRSLPSGTKLQPSPSAVVARTLTNNSVVLAPPAPPLRRGHQNVDKELPEPRSEARNDGHNKLQEEHPGPEQWYSDGTEHREVTELVSGSAYRRNDCYRAGNTSPRTKRDKNRIDNNTQDDTTDKSQCCRAVHRCCHDRSRCKIETLTGSYQPRMPAHSYTETAACRSGCPFHFNTTRSSA